jgi:hypothetical protein
MTSKKRGQANTKTSEKSATILAERIVGEKNMTIVAMIIKRTIMYEK